MDGLQRECEARSGRVPDQALAALEGAEAALLGARGRAVHAAAEVRTLRAEAETLRARLAEGARADELAAALTAAAAGVPALGAPGAPLLRPCTASGARLPKQPAGDQPVRNG